MSDFYFQCGRSTTVEFEADKGRDHARIALDADYSDYIVSASLTRDQAKVLADTIYEWLKT